MRTLTSQEKRTVLIGAAIVVGYFAIFGGARSWKFLGQRRADYQQLREDAEHLQREVEKYTTRAQHVEKLMTGFQMDPMKLARTSVVAQASAAIQQAATSGGMQLGPIRESPARAASKEICSLQLEGVGPVPAVMAFLSRLESVGFPLVIDSVALNPDMRPGQLKLSLTVIIMDFDQWKKEEPPHA